MILAIFRLVITALALMLEVVAKSVCYVVLVMLTIIIVAFYPLLKKYYVSDSAIYNYATNWKHNYPLAKKVFNLWSL